MRTSQKLELYSGISVLIIGFFQVLFLFLYELNKIEEPLIIRMLEASFFLFPAFSIFIGAYFHAVKKDIIGFGILLFFGFLFNCFSGGIVLIGILIGSEINKDAIIGMIFWLLPFFFVSCTMIFAFINILSSQRILKE
jgi:hypothetical protein